jgi:hypothetical protein
MKSLASLLGGMEAIHFQKNSLLFADLTALCEGYSKDSVFDEVAAKEFNDNMAKTIFSHTGIRCTVTMNKSRQMNAWVYYPKMDKNHPLNAYLEEAKMHPVFNMDARLLAKSKINDLGWVDDRTGTVHGVYQKVNIGIHITRGLLLNHEYTAKEKAAVLIHELGHVYTYFKYIGVSVTTNYMLTGITEALLGTDDKQRRVQFLQDLKSEGLIRGVSVDEASQINRPEVLLAVLLNDTLKQMRSQTGSCIYDMIGAEFLADQFCARHGGGVAIITGLEKSYGFWNFDRAGSLKRMLVSAFGIAIHILLAIATTGVSLLIVILSGVLSNPITNSYDTPSDRYRRIRNDLVNGLKDNDDPEFKRQLVEDIEAIDEIVKNSKPFYALTDWFFIYVVPKHKQQLNLKEMEQDLERIATNDLFVKSAKLQFSV